MIGIIGAMDEEVAILKKSMEVQDTMERAGMTFVKGIMSGKEVVVVRSGIGKVNMGICAQILIDCFGVDTLINTGVAGGCRYQHWGYRDFYRCSSARHGCKYAWRSGRTDSENGYFFFPGR